MKIRSLFVRNDSAAIGNVGEGTKVLSCDCNCTVKEKERTSGRRFNRNSRHGSRASFFPSLAVNTIIKRISVGSLRGSLRARASARALFANARRWTRSREIRRSSCSIDRFDQTHKRTSPASFGFSLFFFPRLGATRVNRDRYPPAIVIFSSRKISLLLRSSTTDLHYLLRSRSRGKSRLNIFEM